MRVMSGVLAFVAVILSAWSGSVAATGSAAVTKTYAILLPNGIEECDGFTLTQTGTSVVGNHIGACTNNDSAAGIARTLDEPNDEGPVWYVTTTDTAGDRCNVEFWVLHVGNAHPSWTAYAMNAEEHVPLHLEESGDLKPGLPTLKAKRRYRPGREATVPPECTPPLPLLH